MLVYILNRNALNIKNQPSNEIPKDFLEMKETNAHLGIFTLNVIPKGVKFGPFTGFNISECLPRIKGGKLLVNKDKSKYLNWMQYINSARSISDQNLLVFQHEDNLYYRSNREIQKGEELLVYFGEERGDSYDKDFEMVIIPATEWNVQNIFACTFCCIGFSSKEYLSKHKSICSNESSGRFSIEGIINSPTCSNCF